MDWPRKPGGAVAAAGARKSPMLTVTGLPGSSAPAGFANSSSRARRSSTRDFHPSLPAPAAGDVSILTVLSMSRAICMACVGELHPQWRRASSRRPAPQSIYRAAWFSRKACRGPGEEEGEAAGWRDSGPSPAQPANPLLCRGRLPDPATQLRTASSPPRASIAAAGGGGRQCCSDEEAGAVALPPRPCRLGPAV